MSKDNVVVGFVGLGTMGGRMAANVQRAGFKLVVHDLHRQAASHHLSAGAIWADSPRALAREADVIFSSLPEPSDVEAVALGGDGLIAGIKPGAAYFDLSTNSPSVVKKLNAAFALKGAHMLDAPVSGGPGGAASRKLAIWVGGDENVFDRHKAVLDAIGDKAAYIGPIGSATVAKLVHNMSGYALVCALAETLPRARRAHAHVQSHARRDDGSSCARMGQPRFALGDAAPAGTRGCQDRGGSRAVGRSARACHPRLPLKTASIKRGCQCCSPAPTR
jgi:3-hydroxyisobutyrate dehydrogenase